MKISVVVTVYNIENYIGKCIESIINQTYKNLEIILIDDGSKDSSGKICDEYAEKDSRIVVIHKPNGGVVSARKAGANAATGEYIVTVDGDDWIEADYIENYYKAIMEFGADIVWSISYQKEYSNYCETWMPIHLKESDLIKPKTQKKLLQLAMGRLGFQNDLEYGCVKCIRREIHVKAQNAVDNRVIHGEDLAFSIFCMIQTENIRFIQNDGYHYLQRANSIEHNRTAYATEADDVLLENITSCLNKLGQCQNAESLKKIAIGFYVRAYVLHNFKKLQDRGYDCLYPYMNVKKNSKVVLYGAGAVGKEIMSYLESTSDYTVMAWVDTNLAGTEINGWQIQAIDELDHAMYDYIILATNKVSYSRGMREALIKKGVPCEKIAEISVDVP